jgi:tRNA pseudouridine13 synthase
MAFETGLVLIPKNQGDLFSVINEEGLLTTSVEKFESSTPEGKLKQSILLCPLVGYGFRENVGGRFAKVEAELLRMEELTPRSFYVDELPELSAVGGFRPSILLSKNLSWNLSVNELLVRMSLARGCYATTILREMIKPSDPVASGF